VVEEGTEAALQLNGGFDGGAYIIEVVEQWLHSISHHYAVLFMPGKTIYTLTSTSLKSKYVLFRIGFLTRTQFLCEVVAH
jgi:hypothetical protein